MFCFCIVNFVIHSHHHSGEIGTDPIGHASVNTCRTLTLRTGVCRPCDTIELTATSCNFNSCRRVEKVDRQLL